MPHQRPLRTSIKLSPCPAKQVSSLTQTCGLALLLERWGKPAPVHAALHGFSCPTAASHASPAWGLRCLMIYCLHQGQASGCLPSATYEPCAADARSWVSCPACISGMPLGRSAVLGTPQPGSLCWQAAASAWAARAYGDPAWVPCQAAARLSPLDLDRALWSPTRAWSAWPWTTSISAPQPQVFEASWARACRWPGGLAS